GRHGEGGRRGLTRRDTPIETARRTAVRPRSVLVQVPVDLPRVDGGDVLLPLRPLRLHVVLDDVRAERLADDLVPLELVDGLAEVRGERPDLQAAALARAHAIDVARDRRGRIDLVRDA